MKNLKIKPDDYYMIHAIKQALLAYEEDEVPVGCVIVYNGKIIAKAHNQCIKKNDPTAHAEILAIKKASKKIKNYRLPEMTLYTTLEPCIMCSGAIMHSRINRIVIGALDKKRGALISNIDLLNHSISNHKAEITSGVLGVACKNIIKKFFKNKR